MLTSRQLSHNMARNNAWRQTGVSLIEVLVTTLVLGIGLLGVAALQVSSISSSQEGFYTTQANALAEDLASRVRTAKMQSIIPPPTPPGSPSEAPVPYQTLLGFYVKDANPVSCNAMPVKCRTNSSGAPAACTLEELAQFDLQDVCWQAGETLPEPKLRVVQLTGKITIIIDWASASARTDLGQKESVRAECKQYTNDATRNCIIMELVP
ncbi:type IV pilus modification protein PilV [Aliikangiella maris]|uniref:Type IV pilus modification protein PilV n=2 Tax=Aliikangiella maris TaxID=3162458 RepID=A0ABV2BNL0_9GAMM